MGKQRIPDTEQISAYGSGEPAPEPVTEELWQAVIKNDASYDGRFFYAVKTTRIFCRPSCKSKPPKRENIGYFRNVEQALNAKFRPCKRCKPTGQRLPDEEWIEIVTEHIHRNYMESLTLESLANVCHGTPYHLHRTFKKVKGVTPVAYIQQLRVDKAKEELITTNIPIAKVGEHVGMANTPYFITLFKKITAYTPADYRQRFKQNQEEA